MLIQYLDYLQEESSQAQKDAQDRRDERMEDLEIERKRIKKQEEISKDFHKLADYKDKLHKAEVDSVKSTQYKKGITHTAIAAGGIYAAYQLYKKWKAKRDAEKDQEKKAKYAQKAKEAKAKIAKLKAKKK